MYEALEALNGQHPWRDVSGHGYVDYRARRRDGGRVVYFNFELAREMGILPANHARRMNARLERAILQTFSLQIINEYDQKNDLEGIDPQSILPHTYMATRYLQAQHKDKRGLHSGDGRAVWNGRITGPNGVTYDVSSRGTGATRLSPGAQIARKPIKTGDDTYGYCCGRADLDEMLGTALMSEIFHRNGLPTERTLAVIDFGDGMGIGVRAAANLLRPAHIFRYLKQGRHKETRTSLEYFFDRQADNETWDLPRGSERRMRRGLRCIAESYAKLAALMEQEYIFNWLAWDGDNMLASGAILDYGSIRQFAAKHDKYRYDDVDRFSSTLTEQRFWARELVKVFAQAIAFARTGRRRNLRRFKDAKCLRVFDRTFRIERDRRMLWRLGFTDDQIDHVLLHERASVRNLRRAMTFFEDLKVNRGVEKLPDGITHPPTFIVRNLLRRLPAYYLSDCASQFGAMMPADEFCQVMAASYATKRDLRVTEKREGHCRQFQRCYQRLIAAVGDYPRVLKSLVERAAVINHPHRITGNAIILIVDEFIKAKDKLGRDELQAAMEEFIQSQVLVPGQWKPLSPEVLEGDTLRARLLRAVQTNLEICKETV
jgi:uncharacterized protein YdiU (UPF0061 family)